jgi:outer membrane immunogenic protein
MSRHDQDMNPTQRQASAKGIREMTMTKNILIGAVAALLLAPTAALAADLPMKAVAPIAPIYDWTGFYIGATAGGSIGASDHIDRATGLSDANGYNITGGLGGGTIGYNWQVSRFVVGFEGDASWGSEYGSNFDTGTVGAGTGFRSFTKETWVATARARVGYAVDNLLFYGTGGYAATSAEAGIKDGATLALLASTTSTHSGWVAGVGLEWGFAPNWSAKFEILHMEYNSTVFNTVVAEGNRNIPLNDSIGRVGVNYRFGGPVVAKY